MLLQTSIEYLKGVGPERAAILKDRANIQYIAGGLLKLFPYRYIDAILFYKYIDNSNTFYPTKRKNKRKW